VFWRKGALDLPESADISCKIRWTGLTLLKKPDFLFLTSLAFEASRPCADLAGVPAGVTGVEVVPLVPAAAPVAFDGVPGAAASLATGAGAAEVASPGTISFLTGGGASWLVSGASGRSVATPKFVFADFLAASLVDPVNAGCCSASFFAILGSMAGSEEMGLVPAVSGEKGASAVRSLDGSRSEIAVMTGMGIEV